MALKLDQVCIPRDHPCKHDWRVARLTELLLVGHSWRQVQHFWRSPSQSSIGCLTMP